MNKILFFCFTALTTFSVLGKSSDFEVNFKYQTKIDYQESHRLVRKDGKIVYNGVTLTAEQVLIAKRALGYLVKNDLVKENQAIKDQRPCDAGTYEFSRRVSGKLEGEKGCLGSKRFGRLVQAFKTLNP